LTLKQKTIVGIFWTFSERAGTQGIGFIISIFLARILAPEDFGLIGMLSVFIAVSQSLVDSGFNQALLRKIDADQVDFSYFFYF
jgi:O-antigen/teichoic acid export membrane protein